MKLKTNKYTLYKYINHTMTGSISTYFCKRPYLSKRAICFVIYDFSKMSNVVYSEVFEYENRERINKIRIDGETFEEVEFLSLLKAKEFGWYIKKETIIERKNIIEKEYK